MEKSELIREMQAELKRDLALEEASVQELSAMLPEKFEEQNPQLMELNVEEIREIKVNMEFRDSPVKGVLLNYLQEECTRICSEIRTRAEEHTGRPTSISEIDGVLAVPQFEIEKLDQLTDRAKVVDAVRRELLNCIRNSIPGTQTTPPNIEIRIWFPARSGAREFVYAESGGKVVTDEVRKLPTVTLDTNVIREYWDHRGNEVVGKL